MALASPEVDLRGVTTVSGDVYWRGRIAARLLGMAGRPDIPVFLGEGASLDLDHASTWTGHEGEGLLDHPYAGPEASIRTESAVNWLLAESLQQPIHLVAIGPLTNVATAIQRDPDFVGRLLGLTVMGGLLDAGTMPAAWQCDILERGGAGWPDYNTASDPLAALTVADCGVPITWVPLDITMRAPLRAASRHRLPAAHPLGAALGRMVDAWHRSWFPTLLPPGFDCLPVPADAVAILHDPLTVASLFAGDWLTLRPARLASVIEDGVFRLREAPQGSLAQVAAAVDGERFESLLMARLMRLLTGDGVTG